MKKLCTFGLSTIALALGGIGSLHAEEEAAQLSPPQALFELPNYGFGHEVVATDDWIAVSNWTRSLVYMYAGGANGWRCVQVIRGSQGSRLGFSMALEGETLLLGAAREGWPNPGTGIVYEYRLVGNSWHQTQAIRPPGTTDSIDFGFDVAVSGDDLIVSAIGFDGALPSSGAVYFFGRQSPGMPWSFGTRLSVPPGAITQNNRRIGVDTNIAGSLAAVSSMSGRGSVIVMGKSPNGWTFTHTISNPSTDEPYNRQFGSSIDLCDDTLLVGEVRGLTHAGYYPEGRAHVFRFSASGWAHVAMLLPSDSYGSSDYGDNFGTRVSLVDRSLAIVSAPHAIVDATEPSDEGKVYSFREIGGTWPQTEDKQFIASDLDVTGLGTGLATTSYGVVAGVNGGSASPVGARCFVFRLN